VRRYGLELWASRHAWAGFGLSVIAAVALFGAGPDRGASVTEAVGVSVGPMRLTAPGLGYAVVYRTVENGAIRLFVDDDGRWWNATPPLLRADGINAIDAVDFVDRRHGWVAAYNCENVAVYLYRTSDGGRSWRSLGKPGYHSCGGGPTYLSFVDERHGWMEPVSPNGPVGDLFATSDGGRTWQHLLTGPANSVTPSRGLPCLAPISFSGLSMRSFVHCLLCSCRDTHGRSCAPRITCS
jgi:hypothetical protein